MFGTEDTGHLAFATRACRQALTQLGTCNALYHNLEHTVHVLLVGLQIALGRHIERADVSESEWLSIVLALACHDIGYVRGICAGDDGARLANGLGAQTIIPLGRSDAALMPLHVDRGKCYVEEAFRSGAPMLDMKLVEDCIERTRFPVPNDPVYRASGDFPGLVRGADLIGQLSDPRYLAKLSAIYFEFEENGFNAQTGYRQPGDLLRAYPTFFAQHVVPYIGDAERYLGLTLYGREILASLYRNLDAARQANEPDSARARSA
jgi:hypothetical protein